MKQMRLGNPPFCHMCDCLLGWLHNATSHVGVEYIEHEPFLDNDCGSCWAALASSDFYVDRPDDDIEWIQPGQ